MFNTITFSNDSNGPLKGIKVLDLSRLVAGNTLSMCLSDFSADVLKVESLSGDTLRDWKVNGVSTAWKAYCRNKRSISLNLREKDVIKIILKLVEEADVFIFFNRLTNEDRKTVLIIDDSPYNRSRSKLVELFSRVRNHSIGHYLKGFRMLTVCWSDGVSCLPLDLLPLQRTLHGLEGHLWQIEKAAGTSQDIGRHPRAT